MKLDKVDGFPELISWIKKKLPLIENEKPYLWGRFCGYSYLSYPTAIDAISGGIRSPYLIIENLTRDGAQRNGLFDERQPTEIKLDQSIAKYFEHDFNSTDAQLLVESTLLHELVHWGEFRSQGKIMKGREHGVDFEVAAYGKNIDRYWSNDGDLASAINISENDPIHYDGVPMAVFQKNIEHKWPVVTNDPRKLLVSYLTLSEKQVDSRSRQFKASRAGSEKSAFKKRFHVGIDLYGNAGDRVIACEPGVIIRHHAFYKETKALLIKCDSGLVINYGEVKDKSWEEFEVDIGDFVVAGQSIARVGQSNMLHFEIYTGETTQTTPWFQHQTRPTNILNPTEYLLELAGLS